MKKQIGHRHVLGLALVGVFCIAPSVRSTSVIPPTFEELVAKADRIVQAEVVDSRSEWEPTRSGRAIITLVTFKIEKTWKGRESLQVLLEFLGGTVGEDTLEVPGMPRFAVGDRDVLFVRADGRAVSPLVGFMHGRFQILRDHRTGGERVLTHDGHPFGLVAHIGRAESARAAGPGMPLGDFDAAIVNQLKAPGARP